MGEYQLQTELLPEPRREFILESERESLGIEIKETKREIIKRLRIIFVSLGFNLLYFGVVKYLFPDFSIGTILLYILGSWTLLETIYLLHIWRKQKKALKRWNQIVVLIEKHYTKNLEG